MSTQSPGIRHRGLETVYGRLDFAHLIRLPYESAKDNEEMIAKRNLEEPKEVIRPGQPNIAGS